jgi:hypothetical protein
MTEMKRIRFPVKCIGQRINKLYCCLFLSRQQCVEVIMIGVSDDEWGSFLPYIAYAAEVLSRRSHNFVHS